MYNVLVHHNGRPRAYQVARSSGHEALDTMIEHYIGIMRFSPAIYRDEPATVWVELPASTRRAEMPRKQGSAPGL